MSQTNPKIPAQRGPAKHVTAKDAKTSATFQPKYVNGSLELSGPTNGRPGKLSQYTKDLLVYVAALEKETIGLRDKQSTLGEKVTELNSTITGLEQRIAANDEKHQRDLTAAKNATRTANATMDAERTKANMAEAVETVRESVHNLFDGAPLGSLSSTKGAMDGAPVRAAYFTCGGLHFALSISSARSSATVKSAADNPIKLQQYVITRFGGDDLLIPDKTYLLFLREAATVEGYKQNKKRLSDREMRQLYDMEQTTKVFGCGHTVIEHVEMRTELLRCFTPAIVTMVFKRLEGSNSTNNHNIELIRAVMLLTGGDETTVNAWAKNEVKDIKKLDQAKQKLRSEGYDPDLARGLSTSALGGSLDYEAFDLRPQSLRFKPASASEPLRHARTRSNPLAGGLLGLYGRIEATREYSSPMPESDYSYQDRIIADPYGEDFRNLPAGPTHDLGTDGLFTPGVDERSATKDIKPAHSGECRNNGVTEGCPHESHRSAQG